MTTHLKRLLYPLLALLLLTALVYGRMLGHEFLVNWDDPAYITRNPDIAGFTADNIRHAFSRFYLGNYAPLQILSYMLDFQLWGLDPTGFALTNVLLHGASGSLFYLILVRLTGRSGPAFVAAAVFLVHPVQVESVAWLSQRKSVLAMFLVLLSFLLYRLYRERGGRGGTRFYACSIALFLAALLAKSSVVVFPLVLLSYDLFFAGDRDWRRLVLDKIPFLLLGCAFSLLAMYSEAGGGRAGYIGANAGVHLMNMLPVPGRYLMLLLWPRNLSVVYNSPVKTAIDAEVVAGAVLLFVAAAALFVLARRRPKLFFAGAAAVLGILPVSNIIPQVTMMNDRYLYLPMLGLAPLMVYSLWPVVEHSGWRRSAVGGAGLAVVLWWGFLSWQRVEVWHDSVTLWQDALAKADAGTWYAFEKDYVPGALAEALARKGEKLQGEGQLAAAVDLYREALRHDPLERRALYNLGAVSLMQGRIDEALSFAVKLGENYRHDDRGYLLLGTIYNIRGELDLAEEAAARAVAINPSNEQACYMLKSIRQRKARR